MMENKKHPIIFYDGTCGLCHHAVQFVLKYDKKKLFLFAPLQGKTAKTYLNDWQKANPQADTVILLEWGQSSPSITSFGKGALRICWLMGGVWAIPGLFSFLPPFLYNWIYRAIAKRRFQLFERQSCLIPPLADPNRFLD